MLRWRRDDEPGADQVEQALPIDWLEASEPLLISAAQIKATHAHHTQKTILLPLAADPGHNPWVPLAPPQLGELHGPGYWGHNAGMNRSADWLHQAHADLDQAVEKALKARHLSLDQQVWGHGLGRSFRDLPPAASAQLAEAVSDLEDRLRILDALYIPTRYPDSPPDGAPTDHFGRLQSDDALRHARAVVDAIRAALA